MLPLITQVAISIIAGIIAPPVFLLAFTISGAGATEVFKNKPFPWPILRHGLVTLSLFAHLTFGMKAMQYLASFGPDPQLAGRIMIITVFLSGSVLFGYLIYNDQKGR